MRSGRRRRGRCVRVAVSHLVDTIGCRSSADHPATAGGCPGATGLLPGCRDRSPARVRVAPFLEGGATPGAGAALRACLLRSVFAADIRANRSGEQLLGSQSKLCTAQIAPKNQTAAPRATPSPPRSNNNSKIHLPPALREGDGGFSSPYDSILRRAASLPCLLIWGMPCVSRGERRAHWRNHRSI
jgi:hypothetical protein